MQHLIGQSILRALGVGCSVWLGGLTHLQAQGMPPEARQNIHLLFDQHAKVQRSVDLTPTGYKARTESEDPTVAAALRAHVQQMSERLKKGLPVRRHDPAFAELVEHHDEVTLSVVPTEMGLEVTVTGTTPAGIKIAQNHARVVSDFAAHGWEAHDRSHPAVLSNAPSKTDSPATDGCGKGACCARKGAKTNAKPAPRDHAH